MFLNRVRLANNYATIIKYSTITHPSPQPGLNGTRKTVAVSSLIDQGKTDGYNIDSRNMKNLKQCFLKTQKTKTKQTVKTVKSYSTMYIHASLLVSKRQFSSQYRSHFGFFPTRYALYDKLRLILDYPRALTYDADDKYHDIVRAKGNRFINTIIEQNKWLHNITFDEFEIMLDLLWNTSTNVRKERNLLYTQVANLAAKRHLSSTFPGFQGQLLVKKMSHKFHGGFWFSQRSSFSKAPTNTTNPIPRVKSNKEVKRNAIYDTLSTILDYPRVLAYDSYIEDVDILFANRKRLIIKRSQWLPDVMVDRALRKISHTMLPENHHMSMRVAQVTSRLLKSNKDIIRILDKEWTVSVIEEEYFRAFTTKNGNIFVSTGILEFCENDDQLAFVLGHEIAHVVFCHDEESRELRRMSRRLMLFPTFALMTVLDSPLTVLLGLHWLLKLCLTLPHSRYLEKEADIGGLVLSSRANFDIRQGKAIFARQPKSAILRKCRNLLKKVSSHPSDANRFKYLYEFEKNANETLPNFDWPFRVSICHGGYRDQLDYTKRLINLKFLTMSNTNDCATRKIMIAVN